MFPHHVEVSGVRLDSWELVFLAGVVCGYVVLRAAFRVPAGTKPPRLLLVRYLVTVYVAVLSAQLFSYAFDAGTSLIPPRTYSWAYYYLNPLAGPKTLYGAVVALPVVAFLVSTPWRDLRFADALDRWTPALFTVLAFARLGCLAQGCCYGVRSETFGIAMPEGSIVYYRQLREGLIETGSPALAVVPTQAISAVVIAVIGAFVFRRLARGDANLFPGAIAAYSVFRFAIEVVRDDPERNFFAALSTSQWVALSILLLYALERVTPRPFARTAT